MLMLNNGLLEITLIRLRNSRKKEGNSNPFILLLVVLYLEGIT